MIGAKPLRIRYDKRDGFIRVYDGTRFGPEKYDDIFDKIRYFLSQKSGITYVLSNNFVRIKIHSNDPLPLEKNCFYVMLAYRIFSNLVRPKK